MSTLGQRLKKLRGEKEDKLTQKDVAIAIGYVRDTYANWETDRAQPDNNALKALSKYFNCTIDYLLVNTDYPDRILVSNANMYEENLSPEEIELISSENGKAAIKMAGEANNEGLTLEEFHEVLQLALKLKKAL